MSTNITVTTLTISQLQLASKYLTFAFALPLCIFGVVGNLLNIFVFIDLGNYKHNPSSLYVFCKTFFDLIVLIIGLGLRVLSHGFRIDFSVRNRLWCKLRVALLEIGVFSSFTCLCLQAVDAYFCSSLSVTLRRKSSLRTARYVLLGFLLLWTCHQIPYVILQDLIQVKGKPACRTTNMVFARYRNYFAVIGFGTIIPLTIISGFGLLTYRQLRMPEDILCHTRARQRSLSLSRLTRQMTSMTLFHIITVSVCEIPFAITQIYSCATENMTKSALHQAGEQLVQMVVVTCNYVTFASSFYCYCAASKRFRRQVLEALNQFRYNGKNQASSTETVSCIITQQITTQL